MTRTWAELRRQSEYRDLAIALSRCPRWKNGKRNMSALSRRLEIDRKTLYRLMHRHSFPLREGADEGHEI